MVVDPKSIAVEGIGFGPLATATEGFIAEEGAAVNLVQSSGIATDSDFGSSALTVSAISIGFASSEEYGNAFGSSSMSASSLPSDEGFGTTFASFVASESGRSSDEVIENSSVEVILSSMELDSEEQFGQSSATYDRILHQTAGLASSEAFGLSSIPNEFEDPNDYTNDSPSVITKRRPLNFWAGRRGSSRASDVTVAAESVRGTLDVRKSVQKAISKDRSIAVVGKQILGESSHPSPIVECELIEVRSASAIQVYAKRVRKAA